MGRSLLDTGLWTLAASQVRKALGELVSGGLKCNCAVRGSAS